MKSFAKIQNSVIAFLFSIFALTVSATAAPAITLDDQNPPRWEKLGERKVNFKLDRDEIYVTWRDGAFTAIKMQVKNTAINMHRCVIHFANGDTQKVNLRKNIPAGSFTRTVDLNGGKRVIKKVVFYYDTKNIKPKKGEIVLFGKH